MSDSVVRDDCAARGEDGAVANHCTKCGSEISSETCGNCGASTLDTHRTLEAPKPTRLGTYTWAAFDYRPTGDSAYGPEPPGPGAEGGGPPPRVPSRLEGHARKMIKWETWFVMTAFWLPAFVGAVIVLAEHANGVANIARFPSYLSNNPAWNLVLGILAYGTTAAMVPLGLLLLARTGQPPKVLGMGRPRIGMDLIPGVGLAAASFGMEIVILIPLAVVLRGHHGLVTNVTTGHVPAYYVIWGLALSAITSVTEEVFVNGYLITRLHQLGWTSQSSLMLSLALRTSYHVYYGFGFLLTIPLGYFVTKSFQKHRRLNRSIATHFIFDAVITTIAILR